jgi:general secretion pathway protein D
MQRFLVCGLLGAVLVWGADTVASRLARAAEAARNSGQVVRAYLLYSEAAAREPHNPSYVSSRDALASAARLLIKAEVQNADVSAEVKQLEAEEEKAHPEPPIEIASLSSWRKSPELAPIPHLEPLDKSVTFNVHSDERALIEQVTKAYGIKVTFDPQLLPKPDLRFAIDGADFRTAMDALTAVTDTFLFPISRDHVFVARDTEDKRNQFEPEILLSFPLPNALEQKDLTEAANAVRSVLGARTIGWDSVNRMVMVRDRATRARVAYSLLEATLLPKAQVSFEVQFITLDSEKMYHYGLALPTSFPYVGFGKLGGFQRMALPSSLTDGLKFLTFGGGTSLMGVGLADATFFANYSNSFSHNLYDATVVVSDRQTANFHVGDQYPIPQAISTASAQSSSIYNPIGQVNFVDLGVILKLTPKIGSDGSIGIEVEAQYKALGSQTFNTVPSVLQREYKGNVTVREGEWAVLAGLDSNSQSVTRNGLAGLSELQGLNQFLSENTRDTQTSNTLVVIKPTVTRLPVSAEISPQYLLGPVHGMRVLL